MMSSAVRSPWWANERGRFPLAASLAPLGSIQVGRTTALWPAPTRVQWLVVPGTPIETRVHRAPFALSFRRPSRSILSRFLAHVLIRLLIVSALPANLQAASVLFPVSMLWPLVEAGQAAPAPDVAACYPETRVRGSRLAGLPFHQGSLAAKANKATEIEGSGLLWKHRTHHSDPEVSRFISQDSELGKIDDPPSLHRYFYANASPTKYTDPTGHASYYNEKGKKIGTDAKPDEKVYFIVPEKVPDPARPGKMKDNPELKRIEQAAKKNEPTPLEAAPSAVGIPPKEVREELSSAVGRSNAPTTDDKKGGFHEEGGIWGTSKSGETVVVPAKPGPYSDPRVDKDAHIDTRAYADLDRLNKLAGGKGEGDYHTHPSGVIVESESQVPSGGTGTVLGGGRTREAYFGHPDRERSQGPSDKDKELANPEYQHIVVGARDKTVYFHNRDRVVATFPLEKLKELDEEERK